MSAIDNLLAQVLDWQAIAVRFAAAHAGTPEGAQYLVESKRYGVIADGLRALATQARAAAEVPDGYVIVPVELTDEMQMAGALAHQRSVCHDFIGPIDDAWAAMLASAPPAPAAEVREPLTGAQIYEEYRRHAIESKMGTTRHQFETIARAVERAHGIPAAPAASKGDAA